MAPKVSQHKFEWDLEDMFLNGLRTKIFSMQVFDLDVKCFATLKVIRLYKPVYKEHSFSYELHWTDCENKPLLYSCVVQFRRQGHVDQDDEDGLLWSDKMATPEGLHINSSAVFPKFKEIDITTDVEKYDDIKIEFSFEFRMPDGISYASYGISMAEVALPLLRENVLSDVVVECGEKKFDCHKSILAGRSQVLKAMLTGPFKEADESKIVIRDCEPEVAKLFVEFIYSDEVAEDAVSWKLYDLAKMYDLPKLQDLCLAGLRKRLTVDTCSEMLEVTCKHDLEDLFAETMRFFNENKAAVAKTEGWKAIVHNPVAMAKIALHPIQDSGH